MDLAVDRRLGLDHLSVGIAQQGQAIRNREVADRVDLSALEGGDECGLIGEEVHLDPIGPDVADVPIVGVLHE